MKCPALGNKSMIFCKKSPQYGTKWHGTQNPIGCNINNSLLDQLYFVYFSKHFSVTLAQHFLLMFV